MCCVNSILKCLLILVNIILLLIGLVILGAGIGIHFLLKEVPEGELNFKYLATGCIVFGVIILVIAIFGCCGAFTNNRLYLIISAVLLTILACFKIFLATQVSNFQETIQDEAEKLVESAFNDPNLQTQLQAVEAFLHCCGTTGPESYTEIPMSCCLESLSDLNHISNSISDSINNEIISGIQNLPDLASCSLENAFKDGCNSSLTDFLKDVLSYTNIAIIIIIIAEFLIAGLNLLVVFCSTLCKWC